jgi:nitrate reductase beta subunit
MKKLFLLFCLLPVAIKSSHVFEESPVLKEWLYDHIQPMNEYQRNLTSQMIKTMQSYATFEMIVQKLAWLNLSKSHTIQNLVVINSEDIDRSVEEASYSLALLMTSREKQEQARLALENLTQELEAGQNFPVAVAIETMRADIEEMLYAYLIDSQATTDNLLVDLNYTLKGAASQFNYLAFAQQEKLDDINTTPAEREVVAFDKEGMCIDIQDGCLRSVEQLIKNLKDLQNRSTLIRSLAIEFLDAYSRGIDSVRTVDISL